MAFVRIPGFCLAFFIGFASLATAQTKPAIRPIGAITTGANDRFMMQNGEVVLRQGNQTKRLTQNVRLADGTKVNYKSGIVEFNTGKITTLQEGDYVTMKGDIVFATPASAAAARNDSTAAAVNTKFDPYIQQGTALTYEQLTAKNVLLNRKIRLLNEKIALLSAGNNAPDTRQIDQQLQALEEQLR